MLIDWSSAGCDHAVAHKRPNSVRVSGASFTPLRKAGMALLNTVLIFTMDSMDGYIRNSKTGGASGEITTARELAHWHPVVVASTF